MKKIVIVFAALIFIYAGRKKQNIVLLDSYFNNETLIDSSGKKQSWHYKWEEEDNNGYSLLGSVFKGYGISTKTCYERPAKSILKDADIYIIVDPDVPKENPDAKYIEPEDVKVISDWVREGGVLVLLGNDFGNAEFDHFNTLAKEFGIEFNKDSRNYVDGDNYVTDGITIPKGNPILKHVSIIYMKDISTLSITSPAKAILTDNNDVIMAASHFGKGTVFAAGDPWVYNEYTDGKKLPKEYQNYDAAKDLVSWLKKQISKK